MSYIITGAVCLLVGFVAGLLVYRKHSAALKAKEEAVKGAFKG